MKYLPGDIFTNGTISALSEISASLVSVFVFQWLGLKKSLSMFFFAGALGGLGVILCHNQELSLGLMPCFVLLAKFGVAAVFNIVYIANQMIFPVLFVSTALGACNIFARTASVAAPTVAEI